MIISRISIKKTEMKVDCQPVQHLINKRQRIMILSGGSVQFSVINPYPPSYYSSC